MKNSKGITLIALVITIIVLLILAAVSLNLVAGGDGILGKATTAVDATNKAKIAEEVELAMAELKTEYYEARYVDRTANGTFGEYVSAKFSEEGSIATANGLIKLNGTTITYENKAGVAEGTGSFDATTGSVTISGITTGGAGNTVTIPEGLEVGSTVSYTPSGTYNEWTTAHSGYETSYKLASGSSYSAGDTTLTDMTISSWKVFKIDEKTGEIQLVPSNPTTATVGLKGADGYNNAVKLLNDACSSLYSNTAKGITARSINMEDIESVLDYEPTTYVNTNDSNESVNHGAQKSSAYETNKQYPAIYASEEKNVIDGTESVGTLGLNDAASDWITGKVTATTSIRPYQTYYYSDFSSKLKEDYSSLLIANGSSTQYWVASRCVNLDPNISYFHVRRVHLGALGGSGMFGSSGGVYNSALPVFPVVSLSAELIAGDVTSGWSVE